MNDPKPTKPLYGYCIFEDYTDDFSNWDIVGTGPQDPTGANLAWQDPMPMVILPSPEYVTLPRELVSHIVDVIKGHDDESAEALEQALREDK